LKKRYQKMAKIEIGSCDICWKEHVEVYRRRDGMNVCSKIKSLCRVSLISELDKKIYCACEEREKRLKKMFTKRGMIILRLPDCHVCFLKRKRCKYRNCYYPVHWIPSTKKDKCIWSDKCFEHWLENSLVQYFKSLYENERRRRKRAEKSLLDAQIKLETVSLHRSILIEDLKENRVIIENLSN